MNKYHDKSKYFLLEGDAFLKNAPIIKNTSFDKTYSKYFIEKKYSMFPDVIVLHTLEESNVEYQDILMYPFLLFKNNSIDIIKSYDSSISSKKIIISNSRKSEIYHLPLIPRINCLTENSKISSNKKHILRAELDYQKICNSTIFYIDNVNANYVIIREDLHAKLIKLGVTGITTSQVNVR